MEKVGSYGEGWEELLGGLRRLRQRGYCSCGEGRVIKRQSTNFRLAIPLPQEDSACSFRNNNLWE